MGWTRRAVGAGLVAALLRPGGPRAEDLIELPSDWRDQLARVRAEPKFAPSGLYVGYLPVEHREAAEGLVNDLIDRVASEIEANPSRAWLQAQLKDTFDWYRLSDTEDRDRCAEHLADVLGALGIEAEGLDGIYEWVDRFDRIAAFTHPQLEE